MSLKTLENSLILLKKFSKNKSSWGVRELSKELNMSHSVVSRILKTYQKYGFLIQDSETKKYQIGLMFWQYGLLVNKEFRFLDFINPILEKIVNETGESVFITWLDGKEAVTVKKLESVQYLKFDDIEGSRRPLYVGSRGKVILAYLPYDLQKKIFSTGLHKFTENTISDSTKLKDELKTIREKGWSHSKGEYIDSVFSVSVPIFDNEQYILGSLSIAGPDGRFSQTKLKTAVKVLTEYKNEIENEINFYDSNINDIILGKIE